ncbi:MAG: hypothetical protein GX851_00935 [Clostridiales bacterium]|nr:hypothetical protein [Clostridiales bacterium]
MFVIFSAADVKRDIRSRIRECFNPSSASAEKVQVPGGTQFVKLTAVRRKGEIDWEDAACIVGGKKMNTIFTDAIRPEPDSPFCACAPELLPRLMLFNTAEKIIKRSCKPLESSICVVDGDGILAAYAYRLCPLGAEIRVITRSEGAYEQCAQRALETYGATIFVSRSTSALSECTCVISVCNNGSREQKNTLLINRPDMRFIIKGADFTVPEVYAGLCPGGTDIKLFAAALCEYSGAHSLCTLSYDTVIINGKELTLDSAVNLIKS